MLALTVYPGWRHANHPSRTAGSVKVVLATLRPKFGVNADGDSSPICSGRWHRTATRCRPGRATAGRP